jgi:hypothetical protein
VASIAFTVLVKPVQSYPQDLNFFNFCILTTEPSITEVPQEAQNGSSEATDVVNSNGQQQADSPVLVPTSPTATETVEETKNVKRKLLHGHFVKNHEVLGVRFSCVLQFNQIRPIILLPNEAAFNIQLYSEVLIRGNKCCFIAHITSGC